MKRTRLSLALLLAASPLLACAADVSRSDEYEKLIQNRSKIAVLGDDAFGDHVDLATGGLSFTQTDVDLAGNNGLAVRVGRTFAAGRGNIDQGHFGLWDLDIPYLTGTFQGLETGNWVVEGLASDRFKRCSKFFAPPDTVYQGGSFSADEFWHGNFLHIPGGGNQELLARPAVAGGAPNDGYTYPVSTQDGAVARCLPTLASTSESGSQGEGFEVVMPDGTIYTFNQMVSRRVERLVKNSPDPIMLRSSGSGKVGSVAGITTPTPNIAVNFILPRREVLIYPTQARDRFGNTVTYTWSATNPWRLLQIVASDGRHLDFTYSPSDPNSYFVTSVSDGSRTWTYTFTSVTQPDGTSWLYGLGNLATAKPQSTLVTCDSMGALSGSYTGSVTSPAGSTVEYAMSTRIFGRSWVPRQCIPGGASDTAQEPYQFASIALDSKKVTGPGLPTAGHTWTYTYGAANQCWDPNGVYLPGSGAVICSGSSPVTRTTTVTSPDGDATRNTFGNRYKVDEGQLLKQEFGWNGSSALRTVVFDYADPAAAPYAALNGTSMRHLGDYDMTSMRRPRRKVTTTQQGRTFTWQVATGCSGGPYCFDAFARPTKIIKSSTP